MSMLLTRPGREDVTIQDLSSLRVRSYARKPSRLPFGSKARVLSFKLQGASVVWTWSGKDGPSEPHTSTLSLTQVRGMAWVERRSAVRVELHTGEVLMWYC